MVSSTNWRYSSSWAALEPAIILRIPERRMASTSTYTTVAFADGRYDRSSPGFDPPRERYQYTLASAAAQTSTNANASCHGWKRKRTKAGYTAAVAGVTRASFHSSR